jgi:lipopolysaccharide/colanic/teichoic acid biosynthesis glycosyltransferase
MFRSIVESGVSSGRFRVTVERLAAAFALLVCSPVLLGAAICILVESGMPVFFRQMRVGQHGKTFTLVKLRSMRTGQNGPGITSKGDCRITRVGALLRRYKLDELPQLWNILAGHMQFIGPRPELPHLVDMNSPAWRAVLLQKPGLTDPATLIYRNEEELLATFSDSDLAYREHVLPDKLFLSSRYQQSRDAATDVKLLLLTMRFSFFPAAFDPNLVRRLFVHEIQ